MNKTRGILFTLLLLITIPSIFAVKIVSNESKEEITITGTSDISLINLSFTPEANSVYICGFKTVVNSSSLAGSRVRYYLTGVLQETWNFRVTTTFQEKVPFNNWQVVEGADSPITVELRGSSGGTPIGTHNNRSIICWRIDNMTNADYNYTKIVSNVNVNNVWGDETKDQFWGGITPSTEGCYTILSNGGAQSGSTSSCGAFRLKIQQNGNVEYYPRNQPDDGSDYNYARHYDQTLNTNYPLSFSLIRCFNAGSFVNVSFQARDCDVTASADYRMNTIIFRLTNVFQGWWNVSNNATYNTGGKVNLSVISVANMSGDALAFDSSCYTTSATAGNNLLDITVGMYNATGFIDETNLFNATPYNVNMQKCKARFNNVTFDTADVTRYYGVTYNNHGTNNHSYKSGEAFVLSMQDFQAGGGSPPATPSIIFNILDKLRNQAIVGGTSLLKTFIFS